MIVILNFFIMFAFIYFAAKGVKSSIHHIKLMKYVYSNAHLREQMKEMKGVEIPSNKQEKVIYIVKDQPEMKRITSSRK